MKSQAERGRPRGGWASLQCHCCPCKWRRRDTETQTQGQDKLCEDRGGDCGDTWTQEKMPRIAGTRAWQRGREQNPWAPWEGMGIASTCERIVPIVPGWRRWASAARETSTGWRRASLRCPAHSVHTLLFTASDPFNKGRLKLRTAPAPCSPQGRPPREGTVRGQTRRCPRSRRFSRSQPSVHLPLRLGFLVSQACAPALRRPSLTHPRRTVHLPGCDSHSPSSPSVQAPETYPGRAATGILRS